MTERRQIVLLRGINVGKANRIAMADLRELLAGLGHTDVATVLQSGNAVVTAPTSPSGSEKAVRKAISETFGFDVAVLARTAAALHEAIAADPFGEIATDGSRHLLGFCTAPPSAESVAALMERHDDSNLRIDGDRLYLWCPDGVLASPFGTVDWRRQLGVEVTMRNWNTVTKLVDLVRRPN